jgi:hypothetical protein
MLIIDSSQIRPLGSIVLVRANELNTNRSGIILLNQDRYPNTGWVEGLGPESDSTLELGDFVLIEAESEKIENVPIDFFQILVESVEGLVTIALPVDEEPKVKELVQAVEANSDNDRRIQLCDIFTDETWTMMVSDIKDIQLGRMPQADWGLEYVNSHMLELQDGLFYLIEDKHIEAVIHYANNSYKRDQDYSQTEEGTRP